jgi:hypothetical protein
MPVKDGKQADRAHGPGERSLDAECNDRAEYDRRRRDASLDEWD